MLNNKVIFLMWLYCVLIPGLGEQAIFLRGEDEVMETFLPRAGTYILGRPPLGVRVWTQH